MAALEFYGPAILVTDLPSKGDWRIVPFARIEEIRVTGSAQDGWDLQVRRGDRWETIEQHVGHQEQQAQDRARTLAAAAFR
ncbi:hypothetical protein [Cupriavidus necator]